MLSCLFTTQTTVDSPSVGINQDSKTAQKRTKELKSSCPIIPHRGRLSNWLQNDAVQIDVLRTRSSECDDFSNVIRSQGCVALVYLTSASNAKRRLQSGYKHDLFCSLRVPSKAYNREFGLDCTGRDVSHTNRLAVKFQPHCFAQRALRMLAAGVT
jgi:hypothetical protein